MLLDRDSDLAAIGRQLARVRAGAGRVTVVEGPAGIGKSSLLVAVARFAEADGMTVLRARGGPLEQDAAWGVARQLFGRAERAVGAAALARRALDPETPEPALAGDAMHAAAHGLTSLAGDLADEAPLLLVVDDLHWADAPSLRWLVQLARRLDELPLGLLCAVRSGEPAAEPELMAELLAATAEPPVRPRPLGPHAAEALVRERLPQASGTFAHACHAVTGGNPFLMHALVGHLVAERIEPTEQVAAGLSAFGPEQVARSVERQLVRLPEGAAPLARAFAVLGRDAPLRHAARLAGLDPEAAAPLADALRAAGLLDGHPLVAGALYRGLPRGERALWHADAARMLQTEGADAERVAVHLLRAEPVADAGTVSTLRDAAARASARGAPESAAAFLRRALAEPPLEPAVAADVTGDLGQALAAHLDPGAPAMLRAAVDRAASPGQRCELALRGARALGLGGHFGEALELARPVLDDPAGAPPGELARLEAEFVANAWIDVATVPEALERLRPSSGELWRVNAAMATIATGRAADALALLGPALEGDALERESDSLLGSIAAWVLIVNDELDTALARCDAIVEIARPRGWLIALAHGGMMRAAALLRAGRPRDAEPDARLAFEYKLPVTPAPAMLWALTFLVDALIELDDLDGADAALAEARQLGDPPPGALAAPLLLQARARLRLAQRRHADAHGDLSAAAARWSELGITHPGAANWRVDAVEALEDVDLARRLAEEHLALADGLGLPGPRGVGLRALAAATGGGERIALLEQACELLAGTQNRLEHTRALVDLGAALRRANRRSDAREPLREALDFADRGGMRLLARRARDELRLAGARPRRSALTGLASLTPAEQRVAILAADGHTNREIAERLYVTQRTVETHLTHVFQKLDITSRSELGAVRGEDAYLARA